MTGKDTSSKAGTEAGTVTSAKAGTEAGTDTTTEGKMCKFCLIFKPYSRFRKEKKYLDGHRGKCKDCERPMRYSYYVRNKEKYRRAYQEFLERNPNYRREYYLRTKNHN